MKVLIACEFSGRVREAFRALGHNAWSCDLLPTLKSKDWCYFEDVTEAIHREPPSKDRSKNRSRTFNGIAVAMAQQWGTH